MSAGDHVGKVVQIIGPVLDVEFQGGYLPPIYQALRVTSDGFDVPNPIDYGAGDAPLPRWPCAHPVVRVPFEAGYSTTSIIEKIKEQR